MIKGGITLHTSQLSRLGLPRQILKDGSSVLVRIISDKGGGRYEGSVAGARVMVNSRQVLKPGSSFTAKISSRNGRILLTPDIKNEEAALVKNFELSLVKDENLASFMKSLNLPSDAMTFHLLQQMKQLGMKLDTNLLARFHNMAVKFKGKELRASELLMILAKKGLDFSEEELLELLKELDWEEDSSQTSEKDFSLLNKANKIKTSWHFLPYQITSSDELLAKGCIKVLPDDLGKLKLLNLECHWLSSGNDYLFSMEYEEGKCKSIKLNAGEDEKLNERLVNRLKERLLSRAYSIKVSREVRELLEGTACGAEDFYVFGGQV